MFMIGNTVLADTADTRRQTKVMEKGQESRRRGLPVARRTGIFLTPPQANLRLLAPSRRTFHHSVRRERRIPAS
jgi:hypothetical protein